eukprot:gnl/MRDRNA2_/MRDRNA2_110356_c0_seq1.p1 gnl/MRDRNA2_/MRDRNA2_110356_c0~~gnl/MRDRNA2_/MRDRNA2_110356_c0_seq1.p1  ORF type:complete len:306 (+),score=45.84 gnl/MRDRNA2_/MRDRNA2_110356_c0_seq1:101-1018(+)
MASASVLTTSEAEVVAKLFLHGRLDSKKSLYSLICESEKALELPAEFLYDFRKVNGTAAESEFKKLRILENSQQRLSAIASSLSQTDAGSTTASYCSDEEFSDHPEILSQNSSSTCTPRKLEDEISDQSCFENTDNEMYHADGKLWKNQGCKYTSFEPSQYVSNHLIDLLKTSCPTSPKCGSGGRPRSAGSSRSCADSTRPRPTSAPCRTRPTNGASMLSGTHSQQRVRPASATLESISKSWKGNPCSSGSSQVVAVQGEGRSTGRRLSSVPATCSGVPEAKSKIPLSCVEWRSLAMPIWKKQRK